MEMHNFPLSERETEILTRFARGESAKSIALALAVSHRTVESHSASIMRKLAARNRIHAVAIALEAGYIRI